MATCEKEDVLRLHEKMIHDTEDNTEKFHERLRLVERKVDEIPMPSEEVNKMVKEIHVALIGTLENPEKGALHRIKNLESWREALSSRVKKKLSLAWGTIGSIIGTIVGGLILAFMIIKFGLK